MSWLAQALPSGDRDEWVQPPARAGVVRPARGAGAPAAALNFRVLAYSGFFFCRGCERIVPGSDRERAVLWCDGCRQRMVWCDPVPAPGERRAAA